MTIQSFRWPSWTPYSIYMLHVGFTNITFYGLNASLANQNIGVDTKIIKFELIVTVFSAAILDAILKKKTFPGVQLW